MRRVLAAIVLVGLPAVGVAQTPVPAPPAFPALPPIGLPLPPIGLPLPPIGLPAALDQQPRAASRRAASPPENRHVGQEPPSGSAAPTVVYLISAYDWASQQPVHTAISATHASSVSSASRTPSSETGRLRLDLQADGVPQLYVDGYYVGSPDDLGGELELEAGPHRIEVRAADYETLTVDVKIAAGPVITYRGALEPRAASADRHRAVEQPDPDGRAPNTPVTRTTIYFIPGCYLGNIPPQDVALPAWCDPGRLIVRKP